MQLLLQRIWENRECVIGCLYIDDASQCFTLEKALQFNGQDNVPNQTCIPAGRYKVLSLFSHKFGRMMPHLECVPGRTDIMFHWGNTADDTEGCVLVGAVRLSDTMIGESRDAFSELEPKLNNAWANEEEIWIEVKDPGFAK